MAPGNGKMGVTGTLIIGQVNQSNSQISGTMTVSKYIMNLPQMDGMTIFAIADICSSAAGEFVQV